MICLDRRVNASTEITANVMTFRVRERTILSVRVSEHDTWLRLERLGGV